MQHCFQSHTFVRFFMVQASGWGTRVVSEDECIPGLLCDLYGHVLPLRGAGPILLVPSAQVGFFVAFLDQDPPTAIKQGHLERAKGVIGHMFLLTHKKQNIWRQDILRHLLSFIYYLLS